ncbi:patatin family protein [Bowdeniella nasicola]|uniref:Patatin family protein n=1 Tax=Bowdeniella nasicola TaxID=208480 RepID=A0A1Q5Q3Y9_9ACTO|nr:patatin family protein [Bowdeniella nasicola]OKL54534.1 patatin family protein [Bowdeniella nasicola]
MTEPITDTALIFEGGGMRGAYTSAMAVALIEAGIDFRWVAGISAGSSMTCNYIAKSPERARQAFVEIAADPHLGDWRTFLRGQGLFNSHYIYQVSALPGEAFPFDFDTFMANPADFRIGGFNAHSGEQTWWSKRDIGDIRDLMTRVQASSTMPILMPPVTLDGEVYVDGALGGAGGIAIDKAEADGFSKFVIVLTQPRSYVKGPQRFSRYIRQHYRRYPAVYEALADRHVRYNDAREHIFELEKAGQAYVFAPETMPITNGERNLDKLWAAHKLGLAQARRELPAIREFLES